MKLRDIIWLLNTDDFWISVNDDPNSIEHITSEDEGSFRAMRKYFDCTVKRITPVGNGVDIDLEGEAAAI